jgi:hypothetical protein
MNITPELQAFSTGMMILIFLFMDEWLFWANVNRYIQIFGLDFQWHEVGSGFFLFWRLIDYDNRNF